MKKSESGLDPARPRAAIQTLKEIIEERKEKAVETLSLHYAKNKLPLEEYERLVEYINKIESERELMVVEKIVAEYNQGGAPGPEDYEPDDSYEPNNSYGSSDSYDSEGYHGERHAFPTQFALLSARVISGPIKSGSQFISVLGSEHVKIRRKDLSRRRTEVEVVSVLGDCLISIEPGIRVINKSLPILGSSWVDRGAVKQAGQDGPELVISGVALLGSINIKLLKE